MKQNNRKTRDNGQLKLIISVAIMTNAALMVFAMGVAHKNFIIKQCNRGIHYICRIDGCSGILLDADKYR